MKDSKNDGKMVTAGDIGKMFSEARAAQGLSQEEAARQSRIHLNVIKDIEGGVFDRLGSTYIKSFLKKYSAFLEIDTGRVMEKYGSVAASMATREFTLAEEEEQDKNPAFPGIPLEKMQTTLVVLLSCVLAVLIFTLAGMMRSRLRSGDAISRERETAVSPRPVPADHSDTSMARSMTAPVSAPSAAREAPASVDSSPFVLTLRARGEVWVKITRNGSTLFAGTLKKGDSRTWRPQGPVNVWTGKADMLEFLVNTRKVGVVAAGVVKDIQVSADGVMIGDSWVSRLR